MILCVLIPAFNEELNLVKTVNEIYFTLKKNNIEHHILVINDHSTDRSENLLKEMIKRIPTLNYINNLYPSGFGNAIRFGLHCWKGDAVAIVMADASDSPDDLVTCYQHLLGKNVDCVFGSRFIRGGITTNYPKFKLYCNRIFNSLVSVLIDRRYNDFTNAFKVYKREAIENCEPFISENFSLTLEIPLKIIKKRYNYDIVPISWTQRKYGYSKLSLFKNAPAYFRVLIKHYTDNQSSW